MNLRSQHFSGLLHWYFLFSCCCLFVMPVFCQFYVLFFSCGTFLCILCLSHNPFLYICDQKQLFSALLDFQSNKKNLLVDLIMASHVVLIMCPYFPEFFLLVFRALPKDNEASQARRLGTVTEAEKLQLDLVCLQSFAESRLKK